MSWRYRVACIAAGLVMAANGAAHAYSNPAWTEPQAPFHIADDVYYVGSKGLAAYLITSSQGHVLIDGTVAENAPMIEANIKALGYRLQDVKILLANHAHHDHAGGLAQLKKDTGAQLLAAPADRWALEHGAARGDNTADLPSRPPVKVDRLLHDGEVINLGSIAMTTLFTPGHTPGCTSWTLDVINGGLRSHVLFLCSLTVAGNVLVHNKAYPAIVSDYRKTFGRLDAYNAADIVLPSHPEVTDVLGRHEAQLMGDPDPWDDSGELGALLGKARAELDQALGKPQPPYVPAMPPADGSGWRNVAYAQDRVALQFPAAPKATKALYELDGHRSVPARIYTAEGGKAVYRLTVADISGQSLDREAVFRKVIDRLCRGGKLRTYAEARIRAAFGRQISIERPDGSRAIASVFIDGNRLYELEASAQGPDGHAATSTLIRFQQSLNLYP